MRWSLALVTVAACSEPGTSHPSVIARSIDAHGAPRMLEVRGAPIATPIEHVQRLAASWRVPAWQLPALDEIGTLRVDGGTITRVRQTIDGLPVWGGEMRVLVRTSGELQTITGTLVGRDRPRSGRFIDGKDAAIARAAGSARVEGALARQVWYPSGDALIAAWAIDAYTSDPPSTATRTILAGDDGRVLERDSLTADAFDYKVYAETTGELHPLDGPQVDATPHPTGVPDGSYPAYLPGPNLVQVDSLCSSGDPWLPPTATETVGNNVDAYTDVNAPNGLTDGDFRASITSAGTFGHVYDTSQGPLASQEQQMAAITSLFYVTNWLHDFWYDAGFTEVAANAQAMNYGRGGVEGDPLLAEAQDNALGGSRNNANMSTPDDGMSPRMQVFVWNGRDNRTLTLQPSGRTPPIGVASFGPKNYDLSGAVIVGTDGAGVNPTDGCEALPDATGKIVIVDRGNCTFKRKTLDVQNAGGIGVIVVNNVSSSSPPPMGEDSTITTAITIPAISLTDLDGAALKADVGAGAVTATIHRDVGVDLDGALDSTLIAHEYGHYIHHRLTLCGDTVCRALSEGWGDFSALLLLSRAGDDFAGGAFPFSVYATQGFTQDPGYYGIRRAPYSANMAINSLSYRHMADGEPLPTTHPFLVTGPNSEIHNAGEVWASALWQGYVALQQAGPSFSEVRAKMARYVVAGLAMTPTEASPMEARDAILAAAAAGSAQDHDLLLAAFAQRGFGSCAQPPPQDSSDFVGLVESHLIAGNAELVADTVDDGCDHDGILDSGETAHIKLQVANRGHAMLTDLSLLLTSTEPGLTIASSPASIAELAPGASTELDVEVSLEPGRTDRITSDLALQVTSTGGCAGVVSFPVAVRMNVDDRPDSSTTDSFDTIDSPWVPWSAAWSHVRTTPLDGIWRGTDLGVTSDTRLTSPYLHASAKQPVTLTFQHRHSFEVTDGLFFDGGVIEYSLGADEWQDLSTLATVPYPATLEADSGNAIAGQPAFGGTNPSYPDLDTVTIDLGTALADQTFRIRFRIGTDGGAGAPGWEIDNVSFTGLVGTPFPSEVADDGICDGSPGDDPIVSGGGGCCDAGSRNGNTLLSFAVLALILRRRRNEPGGSCILRG